jgi:hypothetical protein
VTADDQLLELVDTMTPGQLRTALRMVVRCAEHGGMPVDAALWVGLGRAFGAPVVEGEYDRTRQAVRARAERSAERLTLRWAGRIGKSA